MTKSFWIMAAILFIYLIAPPGGGETCNYMRHEWHKDIMAYCNTTADEEY